MTQSVVGALRVNLGLDAASLTEGLTRAQTRLREFQRQAARIGAQMQSVGETLSLAVTGPMAAVAAAAGVAARSLGELQNQSRIAGLAAQDFKVLSIAAGEFGIGQEKLADILKDVNDKFGDYFATGQGPLADFFEQIAPKIGLTADAFRGLSSDQALQLYVTSLQRANVSQAEMTFYMEALASDATALTGVFIDNGRALAEVRAEAERLGLSIDDSLIDRARTVDRQFRIATDVLSVQFRQALVQLAPIAQRLMSALVPVLSRIATTATEIGEAFTRLSQPMQNFILAMTGIAAAAGPALVGLGLLVQAFAAVRIAAIAAAGPWAALATLVLAAGAAFATFRDNTATVNGPAEEARVAIALLNEALGNFNLASPEAAGNSIRQSQAYAQQAEAALKAAEAEVALMEAELARFNASSPEQRGVLTGDMESGAMTRNIAAARDIIDSMRASLDEARRRIKENVVQITSMDDAWSGATDTLRTVKLELEGVDDAIGGGTQALKDMIDAADAAAAPIDNLKDRIAGSLEGALMSIIDRTSSAADAFRNMAKTIIAEAYRMMVVQPIINGLLGTPGADGTRSGGLLGKIFGGFRAEGGPVMPGKAYMVGERGPEMIVPSSAGTVIPNHALGGSGVVINQTINVDGGANPATIRQELVKLMPQIADATVGAVIDARRRGGAMKAAFG